MNTLKLGLALLSTVYLLGCSPSSPDEAAVSEPVQTSEDSTTPSTTAKNNPNILLIVADDLGFTDLGSFGGNDIATPNLDRLAQQGLKLTNFHTAPTCSPTRAMLLTGVDNHSAGMGSMGEFLRGTTNLQGKKGYEGYLTDRAASLPEVLGNAGYNTYMVGKWHLGMEDDQTPTARGFDNTYVLLDGGAGHFDNMSIAGPPPQYRENGKPTTLPEDFYSSEFYTRKMQDFLSLNKKTDKPFFAYMSYTAPHWPLQALPETIERYRGKYDEGYDQLHNARIKAAIDAGVISAESPSAIAQSPWMTPWDKLSNEEKKFEARRMEIYAAMVHDLDVYVGQLIDTLKALDELDNTVIFFMSDNGAEGGDVSTTYQFLQPLLAKCCNNDFDNMGKRDSYLFTGPNWARASVGASSFYKGTTAQGGIKAPAFVIYPGMDGASTTSHRFVSVKDVMPTLLDLAGVEAPNGYFNDRPVLPIEGTSLLTEQDEDAVEMQWELHGNKAIRHGYWKIVSLNGQFGNGSWKLYDLKLDPGEQNDLAAENPEKLAQMIGRWNDYASEKGIIEPQFKGF